MTHSSTSLTPREREVLLLIAQGHQFVEVAEVLVISRFTVQSHVRNLRMRLGACNVAHAVYLAMVEHDSSGENNAFMR